MSLMCTCKDNKASHYILPIFLIPVKLFTGVKLTISQQAITWTHADPVHLRVYAALGGDELIIQLAVWYRDQYTNLMQHAKPYIYQ